MKRIRHDVDQAFTVPNVITCAKINYQTIFSWSLLCFEKDFEMRISTNRCQLKDLLPPARKNHLILSGALTVHGLQLVTYKAVFCDLDGLLTRASFLPWEIRRRKTEEFSLPLSHSLESRSVLSLGENFSRCQWESLCSVGKFLNHVHVCAVSKTLAFELFSLYFFLSLTFLSHSSSFLTLSAVPRTCFTENITCIFRRWHCLSRTWTRKKHPSRRVCASEGEERNIHLDHLIIWDMFEGRT